MAIELPVLDALSISQPWAWLIVAAAAAPARKRVENRQWGAAQLAQARARIGRRIAIHAAKSYDASAAPGLAEYGIVVPERPALTAGAVVGVATLDRVLTLAEALADRSLADQRRYINGPVCLVLRDEVELARPVPARGFLGFWPLSDTAAAANVAAKTLAAVQWPGVFS